MTQQFDGKAAKFDPNSGLIPRFLEIAATYADEKALLDTQVDLTYAQTQARAEGVSAWLRSAGVRPGQTVALIAGRSALTTTAMLGILHAGGVVVPLDPAYAREQLAFVFEDSQPAAVLSDPQYLDLAKEIASPSLAVGDFTKMPEGDGAPHAPRGGADPAWIYYTSGSTGKPKGVVIPHRAILRLGYDQPQWVGGPGEVILASSTIAADLSATDVWLPLLTGSAMAVVGGAKPSVSSVVEAIRRYKPTRMLCYTGIFHLLVEHALEEFTPLRGVWACGDILSLSHAKRMAQRWPQLDLWNIYGPTEATSYCTVQLVTPQLIAEGPLPIGKGEPFSDCFVVDDALLPLGPGETGQLAVAGPGLALGYLGRPELTDKVFIPDPRPGKSGKAYLTGDLARRRPDGAFDFFGRIDRQVKLGGRRIELDGIEYVLRLLPEVADAAVVVAKPPDGDGRIFAFVKPLGALPADPQSYVAQLLEKAAKDLSEGMLPQHVRLVQDLPLTAVNKLDRKALTRQAEAELAGMTKPKEAKPPKPASQSDPAMIRLIAEVWDQILGCGPLGPEATFFAAGGSSLQLLDAHAALQSRLSLNFDVTLMFETPKLGDLAAALSALGAKPGAAQPRPSAAPSQPVSGGIAIIGMAGRFPGAASLDEFWQHIRQGDNLIRRFAPDELEDAFTDAERAQPNYVPVRPVLDGAEMFDAGFFGLYPREAAAMDPQARIFLEVAYEALEDAGLDPGRFAGRVGTYAGANISTYLGQNILSDRAKAEQVMSGFQLDNFAEVFGNTLDSLPTRVAFKLNLSGPALSVGTFCSTSLTAIAQAVTALRAGQCDAALAGGISISFPQKRGYFSLEGAMASPDGVCRPFDKDAGGTVFGHGAGAVVLRRLEDAIASGDRILAVIRGVGLNNDGADKIAYTAPSVRGQAAVIKMAWEDAGLDPATAGYIECHGTATPLGDPIELRGLGLAFGAGAGPGRCALGSVKGNVGHLDAAAGVVGLIKAALVLSRREIPPVANFRALNPRIDLAGTPFRVPTKAEPWQSEAPRRAGISSFGVGGTNVHLVLEEAPPLAAAPSVAAAQILPLSAKTPEALAEAQARLADHLARTADRLEDIAFTLQEGRSAYPYRSVVVASHAPEAATRLGRPFAPRKAMDAPLGVVFMFPGQGSQYPGMGAGLYQAEPLYAEVIDQGAEILIPFLGLDLRGILCRQDLPPDEAARALRETRLTQPAIYLTQIATARLWQERGIRPAAMIGHSVGELAAATLAGTMSFETGLRLIARRGQLMQDQPSGAMLSVRATLDELTPFLSEDCELAAENAPKLQVVAGPDAAIDELIRRLEAAGLPNSRLHTSHAFHSRMMEGITGALSAEMATADLAPPSLPWVSCVTGDWITADEATDPTYWAAQARQPVRFAKALGKLAETGPYAYLEVGAGGVLSAFAGQVLPKEAQHIVQSLPDHNRALSDPEAMALAFGRLWAAGIGVDWALTGPRGRRKVALPTYPFRRKRHWIDPPPSVRRSTQTGAAPAPQQPRPAAPMLAAYSASPPVPANQPLTQPGPQPVPSASVVVPSVEVAMQAERKPRLISELLALLADLSGEDLRPEDAGASFLELGFDSLFLGQFTQRLAKDYGVDLTFRQLLAAYPGPAALAEHLDAILPPDPAPEPAAPPAPPQASAPLADAPALPQMPAPALAPTSFAAPFAPQPFAAPPLTGAEGAAQLMQNQLLVLQSVMAQQLAALSGASAALAHTAPAQASNAAQPSAPFAEARPTPLTRDTVQAHGLTEGNAHAPAKSLTPAASAEAAEAKPLRKTFSIGRATNAGGGELTPAQLDWVKDLTRRYQQRFAKSKDYTQRYRATLADPRSVAGYRPEWKEMVFPLVAERSKGAYITDLDGNRLIDFVNGFGTTAFGHAPDFVNEALQRQIERGYAVGPQSDRAGPVAERFARMVGHERATFCNTGSEAVMAAMRLARAVTGREKVVVFGNDYHGQFDEVLVKGRASGDVSALPIAPGIPRSGLGNIVVLPYGSDASLDWLKANGAEIAAVLVEPVQSRHPELRPADFVRALRRLTRDSGAALVMDEVVTGFRTGPQGMQGIWGIEADMATYGKVMGGGVGVGMLAGKAKYMDALDGGFWRFGDDSGPETAPTFFAGTFVRHPLVVAAVEATLDHLEGAGRKLWDDTAPRTQQLVDQLNAMLAAQGLPALVAGYSSWFILNLTNHDPNATLIFPLLRLAGINVQVGYPCFATTAHGAEEFDRFASAFETALDELRSVGILPGSAGPLPPTKPKAEEPHRRAYPLTEAQTEVWMSAQLSDAASSAFNEGASLDLKGELDPEALRRALTRLVARHDALRQQFSPSGESFTVLDPFELDLPLIDLGDKGDPEAAVKRLLEEDAAQPIDLVTGPPLRAMLLRRGPRDHVLAMTAHHIVCDGWSYNTVFNDLARLYREEVSGGAADLPPAPSFAAYAEKDHKPRPETLAYWREQYRTIPDLPDLPTDQPRGAQRSWSGATFTRHIPAEVMRAAKKAGAKHGCTLFATLFGALQVVLARLSGSDDVVLTVPTGGQALLPDPGLVGHLVNLLPVRAPLDRAAPIGAHLERVRDAVIAAFDHGDCTYGTLVRELGIPHSLNRLPLTEVQFNLEKLADGLEMPGLEADYHPNPKAAVNFDLFVNVVERRDGLRVDVDYNTDLYSMETIARWMDHLEAVLGAIAMDTAQPAGTLALMPQPALADLERGLPAVQIRAGDQLLPEAFFALAAKSPQKIAVEAGDLSLSYADLAAQSQSIAAALIQRLPGKGARVAVALPRGASYLAALLGVLAAGHCYIPLDIQQPAARLAQIVSAADAALVLTEAAPADWAGPVPQLQLKDIKSAASPLAHILPTDSAYIIFTSGSTGVPKGVEVSHGALMNLLSSIQAEPGFGPKDTMLAVTTTSFDIAALELFVPLLAGGRVVIASKDEVLDGFGLVSRIAKGDITHLQATPTLWSMLLEAGLAKGPKLTMFCGGEPLPMDLAQQLLATGGRLWNLYGPTETTIWSALDEVRPGQRISIGHPVAGTSLQVLGPMDELMPPGAIGELNIGGAGLAKGYFNRPDLTEAAFREVALPSGRQRLYRTGDLARRLPDGRIEVLGRRDGQIKLRGFRIELGEIETALRTVPGVEAAAVALKETPRGPALIAYLVRKGEGPDPGPILAERLPNYMVPSAYINLPQLPQTANGKLDRKALPDPDLAAAPEPVTDLAETETERKLAAIWEQVLRRAPLPVSATIYELGADSLTVFRIAARMLEADLGLTAKDLLQHPSIRALAAHADRQDRKVPPRGPSLRAYRGGARRNSHEAAH